MEKKEYTINVDFIYKVKIGIEASSEEEALNAVEELYDQGKVNYTELDWDNTIIYAEQ